MPVRCLSRQVERDLAEALRIRESLGDDVGEDVELARCQEEAAGSGTVLRSLHERVLARLTHWKGHRTERQAEYEAVMVSEGRGGSHRSCDNSVRSRGATTPLIVQMITSALKTQLGQPHTHTGGRTDLSRANLDFLRMEQDKMRAEKERRLQRVMLMLEQLHEHCLVVGESSGHAMVGLPFAWPQSSLFLVIRDHSQTSPG